ncbi:hypothetical protein BKA63DRAFT_570849 [Paraphoma chrysanthemicola]|nr:hypothetical protein BKA63DRAFT_570849 [Paraphoma chrysanthemicola]
MANFSIESTFFATPLSIGNTIVYAVMVISFYLLIATAAWMLVYAFRFLYHLLFERVRANRESATNEAIGPIQMVDLETEGDQEGLGERALEVIAITDGYFHPGIRARD